MKTCFPDKERRACVRSSKDTRTRLLTPAVSRILVIKSIKKTDRDEPGGANKTMHKALSTEPMQLATTTRARSRTEKKIQTLVSATSVRKTMVLTITQIGIANSTY